MKIISVVNHKGGVGKTTSTVNLAKGLSLLGAKVLVIDLDPQANLSIHLGVSKRDSQSNNIYLLLCDKISFRPINCGGVDVIPSILDLVGLDVVLANEPGKEFVLRNILDEVKYQYDYIFIDCPPALSLLTVNALVASDEVIIPFEPSKFALEGMGKLSEIINKVRTRLNKDLGEFKVLITKVDKRKSLHKSLINSSKDNLKNKVIPVVVRMNVAIEEAQLKGMDIFSYNSNSSGAKDYLDVANYVYDNIN